MKIAVIGGGMAGLAAAWLLSQQHRVTLFERHAQPGFTAASLTVPGPGLTPGVRVDVPLRVFYRGYYPTLTGLYAALGVDSEPVDYATTFTDEDGRPYFRYRNLRWAGRAYGYVLPQDLAGARARRIVAGALRFHREARAALACGELAGRTIGEFVAERALPQDFVQGLLLPAIGTVGTCTHADALAYPAEVVAGYLAGGLARESVRRARHGADDVAARLLAGVTRVVYDAGVEALRRTEGGVRVLRRGGVEERFEHAVLATQANQARGLWLDIQATEAAVLEGFSYRPLEVVMHRDPALMPARRADWSPVNARVVAGQERAESTIWINRVQPALRQAADVFQTVQPQREPREDLVIGRARFERPLVDAASLRALAGLQRLHGEAGRRVWLCGSYAQAGVPLLESAARSAYAVAAAIAGQGGASRDGRV